MQSARLGNPAIAAWLAAEHDALHNVKPRAFCGTPRREPESDEQRAARLAQDVPPKLEGALPSGWHSGSPSAAGWYSVGGTNDKYSETCRALFDGMAWVEWVGIIDPVVRGAWNASKVDKYKIGWLRPCAPEECSVVPQ